MAEIMNEFRELGGIEPIPEKETKITVSTWTDIYRSCIDMTTSDRSEELFAYQDSAFNTLIDSGDVYPGYRVGRQTGEEAIYASMHFDYQEAYDADWDKNTFDVWCEAKTRRRIAEKAEPYKTQSLRTNSPALAELGLTIESRSINGETNDSINLVIGVLHDQTVAYDASFTKGAEPEPFDGFQEQCEKYGIPVTLYSEDELLGKGTREGKTKDNLGYMRQEQAEKFSRFLKEIMNHHWEGCTDSSENQEYH